MNEAPERPAHRAFLIHDHDGAPWYTTIACQEDHNRAVEAELDFLRAKIAFLEHRIEVLGTKLDCLIGATK